jgi:hypothetical protein
MSDQIIFGAINFAIVITQQFAGFYAVRLLRQNGIIEPATSILITTFLIVALISVVIIVIADLLILVFPLPTACAKLH